MARLAVLYATFASREDAERIAGALLDERLVACANAFAVTSQYEWRGERKREGEVGVLFKTTPQRAKAAAARLAALHPYEVPGVERWTVAALPSYAAWVRANTVPPKGRRARRTPRRSSRA